MTANAALLWLSVSMSEGGMTQAGVIAAMARLKAYSGWWLHSAPCNWLYNRLTGIHPLFMTMMAVTTVSYLLVCRTADLFSAVWRYLWRRLLAMLWRSCGSARLLLLLSQWRLKRGGNGEAQSQLSAVGHHPTMTLAIRYLANHRLTSNRNVFCWPDMTVQWPA